MKDAISLGVWRRLDNRVEGFDDESARALELHVARQVALHQALDGRPNLQVRDWGLTDDSRPHEFVEIFVCVVGPAVYKYALVPGVKFVAKKIAEKAIDQASGELAKAVIAWLRPKQQEKKILDFVMTLPDGTTIKVDPPDGNAEITITLRGGKPESINYRLGP